MEVRPIPAFYCCYLLRSRPSPAALYVGSTPNPPRRLQQHNGKGGAKQTRRNSLRPWEMNCIVTGFPSKIAALQFEWAWQNTHLTRRIPAAERITNVPSPRKTRSGKNKIPRPKTSLEDKLQNLHLLLRVPSFARWPLHVRFFCQKLWKEWQQAIEKLTIPGAIRPSIEIVLDLKQVQIAAEPNRGTLSTYERGKRRKDAVGKGGLDGVDIGYGGLISHLQKSMSLLKSDQVVECAVCALGVNSPGDMAVTCTHETCMAVCHLTCLSKKFLSDEGVDGALLPTAGHCPKCKMIIRWGDLVQEMTLRARGAKEVAQLTRQSRLKRLETAKANISATSDVDPDGVDKATEVHDDPLPDDWLPPIDDGEDGVSVASAASEAYSPTYLYRKQLPSVIEDSEWDEAEMLD